MYLNTWCFIYFTNISALVYINVTVISKALHECLWQRILKYRNTFFHQYIEFHSSNTILHHSALFQDNSIKKYQKCVRNIISFIVVTKVSFEKNAEKLCKDSIYYVLKCLISIFSVRMSWRSELFSSLTPNLYFMMGCTFVYFTHVLFIYKLHRNIFAFAFITKFKSDEFKQET